jgi:hypothetical protein
VLECDEEICSDREWEKDTVKKEEDSHKERKGGDWGERKKEIKEKDLEEHLKRSRENKWNERKITRERKINNNSVL